MLRPWRKMSNPLTATRKDRALTLLTMRTLRVWAANSNHYRNHRNYIYKASLESKIHRIAPKTLMRFYLIRPPKQPWPLAPKVAYRMTNLLSCSIESNKCLKQLSSPSHSKTATCTRPSSMQKTPMISRWPRNFTDCCAHRKHLSTEKSGHCAVKCIIILM